MGLRIISKLGRVPPWCKLNGWTVPPWCKLNGGTVPPFNFVLKKICISIKLLSIVESFVGKVIFNLLVLSYIPPPCKQLCRVESINKKIKKMQTNYPHKKNIIFLPDQKKSFVVTPFNNHNFFLCVGGWKKG